MAFHESNACNFADANRARIVQRYNAPFCSSPHSFPSNYFFLFFSSQHPSAEQHGDDANPLTCEFNHRGTHVAIGDDAGRVDLWSFVPIRLLVKTLTLAPAGLPLSAEEEDFYNDDYNGLSDRSQDGNDAGLGEGGGRVEGARGGAGGAGEGVGGGVRGVRSTSGATATSSKDSNNRDDAPGGHGWMTVCVNWSR